MLHFHCVWNLVSLWNFPLPPLRVPSDVFRVLYEFLQTRRASDVESQLDRAAVASATPHIRHGLDLHQMYANFYADFFDQKPKSCEYQPDFTDWSDDQHRSKNRYPSSHTPRHTHQQQDTETDV
eukprot:213439_1